MGRAWVCRFHPCCEMFLKDFVDEGSYRDLDIVACLENVDAIIHVEISLAFDWYFQFVVDKVEEDVSSFGIRSSNGEVVDLTFEEDAVVVDNSGV